MWTSSQSFGCDRKTRRSVEILKYVSERLGLFNFSCWPTSSCLLDGTVKLLLSRGLHCDDHSCSAEEEEKGPEGATGSVVHNNHSIIRPKGTPALFEVDRTQRATGLRGRWHRTAEVCRGNRSERWCEELQTVKSVLHQLESGCTTQRPAGVALVEVICCSLKLIYKTTQKSNKLISGTCKVNFFLTKSRMWSVLFTSVNNIFFGILYPKKCKEICALSLFKRCCQVQMECFVFEGCIFIVSAHYLRLIQWLILISHSGILTTRIILSIIKNKKLRVCPILDIFVIGKVKISFTFQHLQFMINLEFRIKLWQYYFYLIMGARLNPARAWNYP